MPPAIRVQDAPRTSRLFRHPVGATAAGRLARIFLSLVVAVTGLTLLGGPASRAQSNEPVFYVKDTGHTIGGDFLAFWKAHDGNTWLGLPITEPIADTDAVMQFYEYGLLVSEPGESESEPAVELAPVGLYLLEQQTAPPTTSPGYRLAPRFAPASVPSLADGTDIPAPAYPWPEPPSDRIALIAQAYGEQGGPARFGDPIMAPVVTNGEVVQWFERGRLSVFTRGNDEVRTGKLGWELALRRGISMDPVDGSDLPLFDGIGDGPVFFGDGYLPEALGPFSPVRLIAPSLGIDAPIEWTGIAGGVMQTPTDPMAVGWYGDVSTPGTGQSVIVAGHVDYYTIGPAVFYSLSSAGPGTTFYLVGPDGTGATYLFSSSYVLGAGEPADPVLAALASTPSR
jgi:hypothetical protein